METACIALVEPVPACYVRLTGKHFDRADGAGGFRRPFPPPGSAASCSPMPIYSDVLLRLEAVNGAETSEL